MVAERFPADELQVFWVGSSGATEALGPTIDVATSSLSNHFVVSNDGATWVPFYDEAAQAFKLDVVAADGSVLTRSLPDEVSVQQWEAQLTVFGPRLVRYPQALPQGVHPTGTFKLDDKGNIVPAETYPVDFADGEFWFSRWAQHASWDSGAHWSEVAEVPEAAVWRAPGQGGPRYLLAGERLAERYSDSLFRDSSLAWPAGLHPYGLVDAGSALVLPSPEAIYLYDLPLPQMPTEIGQLPAEAKAMIARADLFRADAGLPPLTGDANISQASSNHSRYTALNPGKGDDEPGHYEQSGRPGFTGYSPPDRCAAVGATCGSEVMSFGDSDPAGGWLATPHHRPLLGAPQAGIVGAGQVQGGWAVMDGGSATNVLIKPFGYPVGIWRGDPGFSGEVPDPVEECRNSSTPISYPVGIAISLYLPREAGFGSRIEVRKHGAARPMPGCQLSDSYGFDSVDHFVPDEELEPGATYDVHSEWRSGIAWRAGPEEPVTLSHDWSFTYRPDGFGKTKKRCTTARLRRVGGYKRRGEAGARGQRKGVGMIIAFHGAAKLKVRRAQFVYGKGAKRRMLRMRLGVLRRKVLRIRRRSFLRFTLPAAAARRLPMGSSGYLRVALRIVPLHGTCPQAKKLRLRIRTEVVPIPHGGVAFGAVPHL